MGKRKRQVQEAEQGICRVSDPVTPGQQLEDTGAKCLLAELIVEILYPHR